MTKLTFLSEAQLEAISGGNGSWGGGSTTTTTTSLFSWASYKNVLKQSNFANNVVLGGGKFSIAGITNEQGNMATQSITLLG